MVSTGWPLAIAIGSYWTGLAVGWLLPLKRDNETAYVRGFTDAEWQMNEVLRQQRDAQSQMNIGRRVK